MKKLFVLLLVLQGLPLFAEAGLVTGPRKGAVLEFTGGKVEFFITKERKVSLGFLDASLKPMPLQTVEIKLSAEPKSGAVTMELEPKAEFLESKTALPEGEGYTIVVQIKADQTDKLINHRITMNTHFCEGCQGPEYACTCDH